MTCNVKMVASSVCAITGIYIHTLQLRYWRAIHAEFMTHRVFSRNASSSRAIPVKKVLSQVWSDPAGPIHWGVNQPGMQARAELVGWKKALAGGMWRLAGKVACGFAWSLMKIGLHKQVANRLLEPWQYINVVVTATDWDNFFKLRCHPDAQPEIQELARSIETEILLCRYAKLSKKLFPGDWHLPYIGKEESDRGLKVNLMSSTARCARVSYEPFDGHAIFAKETRLHDELINADPMHASPTEHQAQCIGEDRRYANFRGFCQYRWFLETGAPIVPV